MRGDRRRHASTAPACSATASRARRTCSARRRRRRPAAPIGCRCPTAPAVDRDRAAGVREGNARPVLSGHPVDRMRRDLRAFGAAHGRRSDAEPTVAPRRRRRARRGSKPSSDVARRRHRRGLRAAEDAARATAWRLHARGRTRAASKSWSFPEAFEQCGHLIETGALVLVSGKFERDDEIVADPGAEHPAARGVRERLARGGQRSG